MNVDLEFTGRVVAITGAATGFGQATARAFARRGARVFAVDLDEGHCMGFRGLFERFYQRLTHILQATSPSV